MLSAALGLLLAAMPPPLPLAVRSFTLTCLEKARSGLHAFGGIGGVAHDRGSDRWWMASEGLPLIFPVSFDPRSPEPRPRIGKPLTIHGDPRRETFKKVESLALCHDRFWIGTEAVMASELQQGRAQDVRVIFANREGRYLGDLPLPAHVQRLRPGMGTSHYRGIQGLSCSPDGGLLLVSLQWPLRQDGDVSVSRQLLYRWQADRQIFALDREFLLPLSHQLGLMDSVLLGNGDGLLLQNEVKPRQRNTLSRFRLAAGDDIRSCLSLRDCPAQPAPTTVVLDQIERHAGVDLASNEVQYDAMALGPTLKDGRRTLLLVNDDDHCGTLTNPTATIAPGFAGTTFTRILLPPEAPASAHP
ncbi:MAG: esterase-like activity of phytase family protein [Cyanobacteriota bacterium]|jgi:hypothetical protein